MNDKHPITPPPELVQQWWDRGLEKGHWSYIAKEAARWGADQELDACCWWLNKEINTGWCLDPQLRAARRPKPPSLKEQALAELQILRIDANTHGLGFDAPAIRRALEELPND